MDEIGASGDDIKIYGPHPADQEDFDRLRSITVARKSEFAAEEKANLVEARISPGELAQLRTVESGAAHSLTDKITRLGIGGSEPLLFAPINYASSNKDDSHLTLGGHHVRSSGMTTVYIKPGVDLFDSFSMVAHELSHASVRGETRFYLPEDKSLRDSATAYGLDIVGGHKSLAGEIEEGMTMFDQVDFFNNYLRVNFPSDYKRKVGWTSLSSIKEAVRAIDRSLYGDLSPEALAPFIIDYVKKIPFIGKGMHYSPVLKTKDLKQYLLARKICELVGRNLGGADTDADQAIDTGRDFLDRGRYVRNGDAQRKIVEVMGGRNAKFLLHLPDHPEEEQLDEAMKILTEKAA